MKNNNFKIKSFHNGEYISLAEILATRPNIKYRVGCDSLNIKDKTIFITTLVGINPGNNGAFILYQKEKVNKINDTTKRLWTEVEKAISFASFLRDQMNMQVASIDFDLNSDQNYISSRLLISALGYAQSMGFTAYCKPNELHAIYAADYIVHKGNESTKRKGTNF